MIETSEGNLDFSGQPALPGELLAERLAQDFARPEKALQYAIEIGTILGRAHARGLMHGSLSPHAVKITAAGARVLKPSPSPGIQGAPYRSPEQVRGEPPDWRSDIFAFGALLYELACGKRAFPGEGASLDEAILSGEPPALPAATPHLAALQRVIAGCLAKDRAARRQRLQNAVTELKLAVCIAGLQRRRRAPARTPQRPVRPSFLPPVYRIRVVGLHRRLWIMAAVILALAVSGVAAVLYLYHPAAPVYRFHVDPPEHANYAAMPAISPDGNSVALSAAGTDGQRMLWVRALAESQPQLIAGTEGAFAPFWSPDSRSVGFFANRALKTVQLPPTGGDARFAAPRTVCEAGALPGGGTWNRDGVILFAPEATSGLFRVSAAGGVPQPVLRLVPARDERAQLWPQFLPDGRHFVFFMLTGDWGSSGVYTGALGSAQHEHLFSSETNAVYSSVAGAGSRKNGYLLFIKDRNLMGQAFNASTLRVEDEAIVLANDVGAVESLSLAQISVSDNSVMIYQSAGKSTRELVWKDRAGRRLGAAGETGAWGPPRISPDGKRVAVGKLGEDQQNADLWILDAGGGAFRLPGPPHTNRRSPAWSPDGSRIVFAANRDGEFNIYSQPAFGGGNAELLCKTEFAKDPTDWSRDGKYILFEAVTPGMREGIWTLSLGNRHAGPLVDTIRSERFAATSPDGRWLAFQSDENGQSEVYVQPFDHAAPGTRRMWKVSNDGGGMPRWRADGSELFFITRDGRLMAAPVDQSKSEFACGEPHPLFQIRPAPHSWNTFDAAPDGQRFLVNEPMEWPNTSPIVVTTNWTRDWRSN